MSQVCFFEQSYLLQLLPIVVSKAIGGPKPRGKIIYDLLLSGSATLASTLLTPGILLDHIPRRTSVSLDW